jgi:hypothetical protein
MTRGDAPAAIADCARQCASPDANGAAIRLAWLLAWRDRRCAMASKRCSSRPVVRALGAEDPVLLDTLAAAMPGRPFGEAARSHSAPVRTRAAQPGARRQDRGARRRLRRRDPLPRSRALTAR